MILSTLFCGLFSVALSGVKCDLYADFMFDKDTPTLNDSYNLSLHDIINAKFPGKRNDSLLIDTKYGQILGYNRSVFGHDVHIFESIPFAKPPIGSLRFRKPEPIDSWKGVLNATKMPNSCYQEKYDYFPGFVGEEMWNANTELSEDCLYLNIYVPQQIHYRHFTGDIKNGRYVKPKLPVLLWIYGGGYISGTVTLDVYSSHILALFTNTIVVTVQYRVGAFGFLSLAPLLQDGYEDVAPGNMGLWDQALAINWVRDNIDRFGGNGDEITLFGESAGGAAVSIHLLSPITRGLVRRGILQSGTLNAPWSYMSSEKALDIGLTLLDDCGCNSSQIRVDPNQVVSCMRGVEASVISKQQWNSYWGILGFPSAPTIDGVFLPKDPLEMVAEGMYNGTEIMIGSNLNEGTYFLLYDFIDHFDKTTPKALTRENFLHIIDTIFKDFTEVERNAIVYQYTAWERINDGYLNQQLLGDVVGDYFFICPTNIFASLFAERGAKIYYYYFTHRSSIHPWGEWMGVLHGDEIAFIFGQPLNSSYSYEPRERDLSLYMMATVARFVQEGHPGVDDADWPPYTKRNPMYYVYNGYEFRKGLGPRITPCQFWNWLMPKIRSFEDKVASNCSLLKGYGLKSAGVANVKYGPEMQIILLSSFLIPLYW